MKRLPITAFFSFALALTSLLQAQTFNAMILSLDGEGVLTRNEEELAIDLPQSYYPGDELSVKNGKATIMLFSGEEVPLSAVSYYTIPDASSADLSAISAMANTNANQNLLSQSGAAYQIRGKSNVFPMNSKVSTNENITLRFNYENIEEQALTLQVISSIPQKVIFELENINDSIVSLADAPFEKGKSYYWTIQNTPNGKPEMGTIIVSKDSVNTYSSGNLPSTHFETINAVSELYNAKYYFDAHALLVKCIEKYPEYEIYRKMLANILLDQ